ncbi:MAG: hypothetical protein RBS57_11085 [Desulforhabdus sp.]|jgi:hypothetical protein|nr:hypothetical protein [Desulforhabdus sp.]
MSGMLGNVLAMMKRLGYTGMEYARIIMQWKLKLIKVQLQKMRKNKARKNMEKAYSGLGAEVYSLYKQGDESDWKNMPAVQQELRNIEEAESKVFQVDEAIEEINNNFLSKKEEIKEKYSAKRSSVGSGEAEEVE